MKETQTISLSEIMAKKSGSVDPSKFPDEVFDLYSIPAFDKRQPEVVAGKLIGSTKQIVQPCDVLLSKIVPHIRRSWVVGESQGRRLIASGEWIIFRSEKIHPEYLRHVLVSNLFHSKLMSTVSGVGGSLLRARPEFVAKIKIPLPPLEEQKRIADILDRAEALRAKRRAALAQLDELVQSIFIEMFGDPIINPMNWDTKKLEELCVKIFGGGTPSKSKPEYYEGNIPWVTPKDMKQDFIQDSIDHISEKAVEESSTKLIPPNCLLMVIRSGILKKKLPVAVNKCEVTVNQDMKSFLFDNKLTNPYFMLYFFKIYQRELLSRVRSVTADNLEFNQIKEIDVIVPPIEKQQKFAKIVERQERVRSSQEQSLLEINNLFDSLTHEAFAGKLFSPQSFEREIKREVKI